MKIIVDIPDKYISSKTTFKEWLDKAGDDCDIKPISSRCGDLVDINEVRKHITGWVTYAFDKIPTVVEIDRIGSTALPEIDLANKLQDKIAQRLSEYLYPEEREWLENLSAFIGEEDEEIEGESNN